MMKYLLAIDHIVHTVHIVHIVLGQEVEIMLAIVAMNHIGVTYPAAHIVHMVHIARTPTQTMVAI